MANKEFHFASTSLHEAVYAAVWVEGNTTSIEPCMTYDGLFNVANIPRLEEKTLCVTVVEVFKMVRVNHIHKD